MIHAVRYCLAVVFLSLFITRFIGYFCDVNGMSMSPTLANGDRIVISKISYNFQELERFDIIVFRESENLLIKRIIGLPGDHILYKDNVLYVNGERVEEPFLDDSSLTVDFTLNQTIPANHYFVMGDNRNNSVDSRVFGPISKENIEGKVLLRWFPHFTLNISGTNLARE